MFLQSALTTLRPCEEHAARLQLFQFGWEMPNGEIVTAADWLERNRDDLRVRRGRIEMRDGRVIRGKWLVWFLERIDGSNSLG